VIDPAIVERFRKVCARLDSPEAGERAAAQRRRDQMMQDYPGIHLAAFPPRDREPDMSPKTTFTVDDLFRTAASPEFAGAVKAVAEALSAQSASRGDASARVEKLAARFDVEADYDEDEGEFTVLTTWSERTMDKVLSQVSVDEYGLLADAITREIRTELVKVFLASRSAFTG